MANIEAVEAVFHKIEKRPAAYVVVSADSIQGGNNRIASRVCHHPADQRDTIYSRMRRQGKLEGTCMLQNNDRILLSYGSGHEAAQAKACGNAADVERWVAFGVGFAKSCQ